MKQLVSISLILYALCSCGNKEKIILYHEGGDVVAFEGFVKNEMRNGSAKHYDERGKLLSKGEYEDDYKVGKWIYFNNDQKLFEIEWSVFKNSIFKINYPKNWLIKKDGNEVSFQESERKGLSHTENFVIGTYLNHELDEISFSDFTALYMNNVLGGNDVLEYQKIIDKNESWVYKFILLNKRKEEILNYTALVKFEDFILDVNYSTLNQKVTVKKIKYQEMLVSLTYKDEKALKIK